MLFKLFLQLCIFHSDLGKIKKEKEYSACCIYRESLGKPFLHFFTVIH